MAPWQRPSYILTGDTHAGDEMCELFGLSSNRSVGLTISLQILAAHGGRVGPHRDGWGIACYEDEDVRLIKDPGAASDSDWIRFLESHVLRSDRIICHIRRATRGARTYRNTQPFNRELGGRRHVFAHNGDLDGLETDPQAAGDRFRPIGETDSEAAFCALMNRMAALWRDGVPPLDERCDLVADFAAALRRRGPANFLYGDGDVIFAHGHRRRQPGRDAPAPPGLMLLSRRCAAEREEAAIHGVGMETGEQEVALIASVPLTGEPWRPLAEGEVVVLRGGRVVLRRMAEAAES